ncbi:MAG: L-threonylcarbamoyladenylate synthase [Anaerolineaceae bacterium]
MNTQIVHINDPHALEIARAVLLTGGLVAFPTDTVYGLGCLLRDSKAIDRLYQVKERSQSKAIAVLIGDVSDLQQLTVSVPPLAASLAQHFWPGALTLIFPIHPDLPPNLSPFPTIGIRMPDHAFARELLRLMGPLATTSANISGQESPVSAEEVADQLNGRIELILDGGKTPGGIPSTVVDCTTPEPRILRAGALSAETLGLISA